MAEEDPPAPSFACERFEAVPAGAGTVLLRVEGRWSAPRRGRLGVPALLVDDGRRTRRISPLPAPGGSAPLAGPQAPSWRVAFSGDASLVADEAVAF
ncbi:hypothetical protein, partial [Patulibacter medicamentivorans]|uniref:hypothetical protein n=1 Tax=Patulibacter medicamentivorans TaxID=1097667 RepID=UPI00058CE9FD